MNSTIPGHTASSGQSPPRPAVLALLAVAGGLAAGALALWVHYGTAVFYETIVAGFDACF